MLYPESGMKGDSKEMRFILLMVADVLTWLGCLVKERALLEAQHEKVTFLS